MSRWPDDARTRLAAAAVDLYLEQGYDRTTVAQVAGRAGVTERTYFRHFPDKREVLFANQAAIDDALVDAVATASGTVRDLVVAGLTAVAASLQDRHAELARRQPLMDQHPDLRERELAKLGSWSTALAAALAAHGIAPDRAALAASVAIAVLDVTARDWLGGPGDADLARAVREALDEAAALLGGS
ncbi:helix-turn-helix domain-containing protein [Nocardioides sp. C4-1]|uniref:TetR/AcrR family transcriptional regulator n=1 Tax=Nocardioides sp. C4-1 TaxID=3151851 RepID=UPI003264ED6D